MVRPLSTCALLLSCLLLLTLTPSLISGAADSTRESDVIVLTDANFDELTSSGSWLLEFYAPWCGHCKTLAPTYEDAARKLRGTLQLAKIDATVQTALSARYDIKGFPSLKFFREGEIRNYNGARTVDGIVAFGKEMTAPAVHTITTATEFDALAEKYPVSAVFFGGKGGPERRLFDSLAYRLQGSVRFFAVDKTASEIFKVAGVDQEEAPIVLLITKHADSRDASNRYSGPWVAESFREWTLKNKLPLITELNQDNFEDVTTSGKKIVYIVVNTKQPKQTTEYLSTLYDLAKQPAFRDAYVFASLDGIKYNKYVSQFGVTVGEGGSDVSQLPTVVVIDKELDYYYAPTAHTVGETQKIHPIGDASKVDQFLSDILQGRIGLTGTTPWYNPSRYVKIIEKSLSKLPVWQSALLAVFVMLTVVAGMFWCCFYGLDSGTDDMTMGTAEQAAATALAQEASDKIKKESATSSSASEREGAEGLRSRKGN